MANNLYLTVAELKLFKTLPASLQQSWSENVTEETSDAFETEEELKRRMSKANSEVKQFTEKLAEGMRSPAGPSAALWTNLPEDVLPQFLNAIGACGICMLIEISMKSGKVNADGMKGIAALSIIRHNILLRNAAAVI